MKLYLDPKNKWTIVMEDENSKKIHWMAIPPTNGDRTDIITDKNINIKEDKYFYGFKGIIVRIRNGEPIKPESAAADKLVWNNLSTPGFCYYNNNAENGALYNNYVVNTGKICPVGWRIPTRIEWSNSLVDNNLILFEPSKNDQRKWSHRRTGYGYASVLKFRC